MTTARPKLSDHPPAHSGEDAEFSGQRRLIRPSLAERFAPGHSSAPHGHGTALTSRSLQSSAAREESSHAEVFYFQKQIQAQTRMVVVLENGEEIEGIIEWYDRYALKLRNLSHGNGQENGHKGGRTRVLIYKDCIRYIYKAGEDVPQTMT